MRAKNIAVTGDVGFWVAMGVVFGPAFGVAIAIIYGNMKDNKKNHNDTKRNEDRTLCLQVFVAEIRS